MNRLDLIPENAFVTAIRDLEESTREIKGLQYMGADVLVPKVNLTGNQYDIVAIFEIDTYYITDKIITFTAEHQPNPFASLNVKFYNASMVEITDLTRVFVTPITTLPDTYTVKFSFNAERFGTDVFYAQIYILSTDTGTISIT